MFLEIRQYSRTAPEGIGALNTVLRVPYTRNDDSILYHSYEKLIIVWKLFTRHDSLSVALKPPNARGLLGLGIAKDAAPILHPPTGYENKAVHHATFLKLCFSRDKCNFREGLPWS